MRVAEDLLQFTKPSGGPGSCQLVYVSVCVLLRQKKVGVLSGGERNRLQLAKASISQVAALPLCTRTHTASCRRQEH